MTIDTSILVNKDKLLYDIIKAKVIKKKHNLLSSPFKMDRTLAKCIALLQYGADSSKLQLSEKDLGILSRKQKGYYFSFLKELHKQVKTTTSKTENKEKEATSQSEKIYCTATQKRGQSNDSAYESEQSSQEEPKSKKKLQMLKNSKVLVLKKYTEA